MSLHQEKMSPAKRSAVSLGMSLSHNDGLTAPEGLFIFDMRDAETGEQLVYWEKKNIITKDAGILAARLFKDSAEPHAGQNNGIRMLSVGTGATGNLLSPDAPMATQRRLNNEIERKSFATTQFRNADGVAVDYPTNIVDFTTTFGEAEAVGPLNEMGLLSTMSASPATKNHIENGPNDYDATIDVSEKDILVNYLTFSVVTKPATAVLSITWRLSF
jgi:hypothetical protein